MSSYTSFRPGRLLQRLGCPLGPGEPDQQPRYPPNTVGFRSRRARATGVRHPTIQALGGIMAVTGEAGGGPVKAGVPISRPLRLACMRSEGITRRPSFTGLRQGTERPCTFRSTIRCFRCSPVRPWAGSWRPVRLCAWVPTTPHVVPYGVFPTGSGFIVIAAGTDAQFASFAGPLGDPEL